MRAMSDPRLRAAPPACEPAAMGDDPMTDPLTALLAERAWLLADGATGTTLFNMGLEAGDEDVFRKVKADLGDRVTDSELRSKMNELMDQAISQLGGDRV